MVLRFATRSLRACLRDCLSSQSLPPIRRPRRAFATSPDAASATLRPSPLIQSDTQAVPETASRQIYNGDKRTGTQRQGNEKKKGKKEKERRSPKRETMTEHKRIVVDTAEKLSAAVAAIWLEGEGGKHHNIYIDTEGRKMSMLNIFCNTTKTAYLIDVHTLGSRTFEPCLHGSDVSLATILSSKKTRKVCFDMRLTVVQLREQFNIRMRQVEDIQLMEYETRTRTDNMLGSLNRTLTSILPLRGFNDQSVRNILSARQAGREAILRGCGGEQEALDRRPLSKVLEKYCDNDIRWLHTLWCHFSRMLTEKQAANIKRACFYRSMTEELPKERKARASGPPYLKRNKISYGDSEVVEMLQAREAGDSNPTSSDFTEAELARWDETEGHDRATLDEPVSATSAVSGPAKRAGSPGAAIT